MSSYKAAFVKTFFDNMVLPYLVPENFDVQPNKWYLVNTKFGEDVGLALSCAKEMSKDKFQIKKTASENHSNHDSEISEIEIDDASILETKNEHIPLEMENLQIENFKFIKEISTADIEDWHHCKKEEKKAFDSAKKEIEDLKLEMKLINVHFLYQKKKIIFNFTADNRIDFRQLVKRLAGIFKTRIEMRQIGVRDAAKVLGGYGVCGVLNCCLRSNCHMNSIYLKMAKDQGFVVNSSKLTGSCGRLMCCLSYEASFYAEERKKYPEIGSIILDGAKSYRMHSQNYLTKEIFAVDEHHHQKKFSLENLKFFRKDSSGVSFYKVPEIEK
jgi:cell fate regulator YaaT (PSP1 superfamily)